MFEDLGRPVLPGELLSGLPPGLDDRFLTVPLADVPYFPGTAVPVVSVRYLPRQSGLFVPERYRRPPQPLDGVGSYIGGADFFGHAIPAAITVDHLRRITFPTVLKLCTDLLRIADNAHGLSQGLDVQLRPLFGPTGWRRMQALCADGSRFLVAPQVVLMLLKYSALFSGDHLLPDVEEGAALIALLGTADDLGRQDEGDDGRRVITAGTPGLLERHVVAAHHFHAQMDLHHVLAKFVRQWKQYPTELAGHPRVVDLAAEFHNSLGIELDDFIAVGMTLYLASTWHGSVIPRQILNDLALRDRAAVDRILRLVACRPEEIRAWARSTNLATAWDFGHLELRPVVNLDDQLLLVRPRWLLQRFFGWVPMYDILAHLGEGAAADRRRKKIKGCMEHLGEVYARETLRAQARRHGLRVHDEAALTHSLRPGRSAGRICDLTLDDGRRWALFEMTTSRLNRESATSASASRLDDDLTKLLGKIDQLDQTVAALRDNESALTGEP